MLSQQHKKGLLVNQVVDILNHTGEVLLNEQTAIARTYYRRRTGNLISQLSNNPYSVTNKTVSPTLLIKYPKSIRFLDMKRTGRGTIKENYHPIYNKPFYGFVYGYAYGQLRYGLSGSVNEAFVDPLKSTFKANPIWV